MNWCFFGFFQRRKWTKIYWHFFSWFDTVSTLTITLAWFEYQKLFFYWELINIFLFVSNFTLPSQFFWIMEKQSRFLGSISLGRINIWISPNLFVNGSAKYLLLLYFHWDSIKLKIVFNRRIETMALHIKSMFFMVMLFRGIVCFLFDDMIVR